MIRKAVTIAIIVALLAAQFASEPLTWQVLGPATTAP